MAIKIKQMVDLITGKKVYPLTTTKAVKDTTTKKSLFELLKLTPFMDEVVEEEVGSLDRDADTLGGKPSDDYALRSDYNGIICVMLASNWKDVGGSYQQSIAIPSLNGNEFFDVELYDDGTATDDQIYAFGELVTRVDVNDGEVVVSASEKPTVTFSVILRGMCTVDTTIVANLSDIMSDIDTMSAKISRLYNHLNLTE